MSLELCNNAAEAPAARAAGVVPAVPSATARAAASATPPVSASAIMPATATAPVTAPRFPGDWVDAMLYLGHGTVRITGRDVDRILLVDDFEALRRAVPQGSPAMVQINPDLGRMLVPGGHARAGRSFFTLSSAG